MIEIGSIANAFASANAHFRQCSQTNAVSIQRDCTLPSSFSHHFLFRRPSPRSNVWHKTLTYPTPCSERAQKQDLFRRWRIPHKNACTTLKYAPIHEFHSMASSNYPHSRLSSSYFFCHYSQTDYHLDSGLSEEAYKA